MDLSKRVLKAGDPVIYFDEQRQPHHALVTIWHGCKDGETVGDFQGRYGVPDAVPGVNLVFVVSQEGKTDPYGRQIERKSSCTHGSRQSPPNLGNHFLFADEAS